MSPVRILVTGAFGYVGRHLCWTLSEQTGVDLHGTYRTKHFHHADKRCQLHRLDLNDIQAINQFIQELQPQQIYHVAGNIHAGRVNNTDARTAWNDNLLATLNLYDACLSLENKPRIVFAGTGAVYGQATDEILEATPLKPLSSYAASKAAADVAGYQYWAQHGLPIINARLFNYLGAGQDESTALSRFAHQLARLENDRPNPAILRVGNLEADRDFLDIADLVSAMMQLMEHGKPGEAYNVARGISHPMQWYLEKLLGYIRIPVQVVVDETRYRSAEAQKLKVNISKLQALTHWKPEITLDNTLAAMVEACRSAITG